MAAQSPFIVVGLGNPGSKYVRTPHNAGFWVIDALAQRWKTDASVSKFNGQFVKVPPEKSGLKQDVVLFKPETFMNLSGDAVQPLCAFFKVDVASNLLVLVDDLDTPKGQLRLRHTGGTGGHNGLESLVDRLGTENFARLRLGIGRSETLAPEHYVLAPFTAADAPVYEELVKNAADAVVRCIEEGVAKAMNKVNIRKQEK